MTGNAYQKHAMRTNDRESTYRLVASIASHDTEYDMGGSAGFGSTGR